MSGQATQLQNLMAFFKVDGTASVALAKNTPAAPKAAAGKPTAERQHPAPKLALAAAGAGGGFVKF